MCTVHGPHETSGAGSATEAVVDVDVNIAGFAGVDRKRRAGGSDRFVPLKPQKNRIHTVRTELEYRLTEPC